MDKEKTLINFIAEVLGLPVIFNNQGHTRPKKPFITAQIINIDSIYPLSTEKKVIEDKKTEITKTNRVEVTIQFNCVGRDILESHKTALKLSDFFDFVERESLWDKGIGVISIGEIKDRTIKLEETKYDYISSMDIVVDYNRKSRKVFENLQSIELDNKKINRRDK